MKRFALLLVALLLCGCSLRNPELLLVEALTDGASRPNALYAVVPIKEQEKDLEFKALKRNLENRMREAGLRVTENVRQADATLFANYTLERVTEQVEVQEPVYGTTGSISRSVSYVNRRTGRRYVETTTYPRRGIIGHRTRSKDVVVHKATLAITAVSRSTGEELWRTVVAYMPDDPDRLRTLDIMLMVAGRYLNRDTPGYIRLELEEGRDGLSVREALE